MSNICNDILAFSFIFFISYLFVLLCDPGVNVKLVTGDHLLIVKQTAKTLNMGTNIFTSENPPMLDPETKQRPPDLGKTYGKMCLAADGFASTFPEHKVSAVLFNGS
jgi:magnesium-transporting ATPase (P-type)